MIRLGGSAVVVPPAPGVLSALGLLLRADDPAGVREQFVLQRAILVASPLRAQPAQQAVEDHREEIIHQRRVPALQELALQIPVMRDQILAAHLSKRPWRRGERGIQPLLELPHLPIQPPQAAHKPEAGSRQRHSIREFARL